MPDVAASNDQVIQLNDAVVLIDHFPALSGLDLSVSEGEILLLKGPNGAGKTTLLNLCAGLMPLQSGSGSVLGNDLSDRDQRRLVRRLTGLLAHQSHLYEELTVEQNVRFWAKANKVDSKVVEPVMERLGLAGRLRTVKVRSLSSGQRKRTSIASIVCRRPRVWLLDEPYAGLDIAGCDLVDALVQNAVAFGATVVFSSHDFSRADSLATRVVEVKGGQIPSAVFKSGPELQKSGPKEPLQSSADQQRNLAEPTDPVSSAATNGEVGTRTDKGEGVEKSEVVSTSSGNEDPDVRKPKGRPLRNEETNKPSGRPLNIKEADSATATIETVEEAKQ